MNQEEIVEANKMIARFDPQMTITKVDKRLQGNRHYKDGFIYQGFKKGGDIGNIRSCDNLKYRESWDWIMPVFENITRLTIPRERVACDIGPKELSIYGHIWSVGSGFTIGDSDFFISNCGLNAGTRGGERENMLHNTWKACFEFIKWYNAPYRTRQRG